MILFSFPSCLIFFGEIGFKYETLKKVEFVLRHTAGMIWVVSCLFMHVMCCVLSVRTPEGVYKSHRKFDTRPSWPSTNRNRPSWPSILTNIPIIPNINDTSDTNDKTDTNDLESTPTEYVATTLVPGGV